MALAVGIVGLAGVWLTLDRYCTSRFSWAPGVRPSDGPAGLMPRLGALLDFGDLEPAPAPSVATGRLTSAGVAPAPAPLPRPAEPAAELAGSASAR